MTTHLRFNDEQAFFESELDKYFSEQPLNIDPWETELHRQSDNNTMWSPFQRKIIGYQFIAEHCPVHIFRHCPFYFEINTGRSRTDLGKGGLGSWLKRESFGQILYTSSCEWWNSCFESGLSLGWPVLDDNHHTVSYEKVLHLGLRGLITEAEKELTNIKSVKEQDFLNAVIAGNNALIRIAERFAEEADSMLLSEDDPDIRKQLELISKTARRVPAEPAASFYEALCVILFIFYILPSVEGNGISVFGHVDRLLIDYYRHDIETGQLTPNEARDLLSFFLSISDVRYGMRKSEPWHVGTNGTITLGGCDKDGTPIFNEITLLIIEIHRDLKLIDPKINARISLQHPIEYFELLADSISSSDNTIAIFNDDVIIPANTQMGKALEDSRLYVGGGCQENVLENCEINSRAIIYLNLMHVFLMGFFPEKWNYFFEREGIHPACFDKCSTFNELYEAFLKNLKAVVNAHIIERNRTEKEGIRFNPCPIHSSMLNDCITKHMDMMEGGCRYSFGSISLTGIGTLIDSLFAVKTTVYDQHMVSLNNLRQMLATNFKGAEAFQNILIRQIPKFGQEDNGIRIFSSRVFSDVAQASSGMPNTRGGSYEASLFSFRSFVDFGVKTSATPDGRRAGEHLSPGMSPSMLAIGQKTSIGDILSALEPLNLTLYPVVGVLDVKLPSMKSGISSSAIVPVIHRFLTVGGSVLQVNCVDQEILKDARKHPELYPDLIVRVSGYSSQFIRLSESIQDEIIARTIVNIVS
ncbi:MAG: pyruvate formate lyase family protein [bacterium]